MNTAFRHARLGKQSQSSDTRPASIFSQTELFFSPSLTFIPGACVRVRRQMTLEEGKASSTVSPAEELSPRAYSLSCSPTWLLCWAPVSSALRTQPCVAVLFSPFLTHRRYDFVKSPRRGKQELWELAAGLPSGHIHSDFWAAQGEEVQAPHRLLAKRASLRAGFHRGPPFIP